MTDIEIALTNVGEIATRDIAKAEHPKGLKENLNVAKRGGGVAKGTRDLYEKETKKSAISNKNNLNYKYIEDAKLIKDKESKNLVYNNTIKVCNGENNNVRKNN